MNEPVFRILITTCYASGEGAGVHTIVERFSTREAADEALSIVNAQKCSCWLTQTALALYTDTKQS